MAVAASRPEKAKAFADEHNVPDIAESYAELIDSPEIDAVYNALPPDSHERWSVAALQAGKHVLCEKPFAMNSDGVVRQGQEIPGLGRQRSRCLHLVHDRRGVELDVWPNAHRRLVKRFLPDRSSFRHHDVTQAVPPATEGRIDAVLKCVFRQRDSP
jgi:hypothetical protein